MPAHPANWVQRHAGQPLPTNRDHKPPCSVPTKGWRASPPRELGPASRWPTTTYKPRPQASLLSTHQGLACQPTPRIGSSVTLANHYLQTATTDLSLSTHQGLACQLAPRTACGAPAANWVQRHAGGYIWVGAVTLKRERAFSMTVLAAVHRFSRAAARAGSAPFTRQEL